jgi:hypothetical protein
MIPSHTTNGDVSKASDWVTVTLPLVDSKPPVKQFISPKPAVLVVVGPGGMVEVLTWKRSARCDSARLNRKLTDALPRKCSESWEITNGRIQR